LIFYRHYSNDRSTEKRVAPTAKPKNLFKPADRTKTNTDNEKTNEKIPNEEISNDDSSDSTFTKTHVIKNNDNTKNHPIIIDGATTKDHKAKPKLIIQPKPTLTELALREDKLNAELAFLEHELQELNTETKNNDPNTSDAPSKEDAMDEEEEIIFSPSSSSDDSSAIPLPPLPPSALIKKNNNRPNQKVTVTTTETNNEPTVPIDTTPTSDEPDMNTTLEHTQPVPHIDNECRYLLIITVSPHHTPWPKLFRLSRICLPR
jgi:hypothetical protein